MANGMDKLVTASEFFNGGQSIMQRMRLLVVTSTLVFFAGIMGNASAGWLDKIQSLWGQTVGQTQAMYDESWASLPGEIHLCVAKELRDWITNAVLPAFNKRASLISVVIDAHGSGELANAMNAGNTMGCDILIPGSDISAMRWKGYDINKKIPVAYSPTVWVGDKEKLDAARAFLKKAPGESLSCNDLAQVAAEGRYSKIKKDGKGRLELEITTSNSGQSMYISCVYSIADALDPKEVEDKLNKNPELEDKIKAFFNEVTFQQDSTTTLTLQEEGGFMHPNGIGYKHIAIATYESLLPQLDREFIKQGKVMEVIYPSVSVLNNFPAVRITTEGKNGKATEAFLNYMLSEEAQHMLLLYGFRPANPKVSYVGDPISKYFNSNIEIGDAPATRQLLRDMWAIVSSMDKAKAVQF